VFCKKEGRRGGEGVFFSFFGFVETLVKATVKGGVMKLFRF